MTGGYKYIAELITACYSLSFFLKNKQKDKWQTNLPSQREHVTSVLRRWQKEITYSILSNVSMRSMVFSRLKPLRWKLCRRSWASMVKKVTNFSSKSWTREITWSLSAMTNSRSVIRSKCRLNSVKRACVTTLLCPLPAMWWCTVRSCSYLSNVIRSSQYGVLTVHRRGVIVSFISVMPTWLVRTHYWMR